MAAWFAWLVGAPLVVILTDVDGIFEGGNVGNSACLIRSIRADELKGATAVDRCTAPFLAAKSLDCWVLNGADADRLTQALSGGNPTGTFIKGR